MPHDRSRSLDSSAPTSPAYTSGVVGMPARIGPYTPISVLGEGGFGVVYLAEQTEPIARRLALKVLKAGMSSASVLSRFELERRALGMMSHPNVARVFDAGQTEQGLPYFAMEVVQGLRITEYCDAHHLTINERIELLATVCDAVQHAHTKGIIHRDLKPSNILVEEIDGKAVPKVIDFGVAKAIAPDDPGHERTLFTERGVLIGTPEYMPPEQARSGFSDVDTRADVYSLGVVLYELLTGALPHDPEALRKSDYDQVMRILREEDPPSPAKRLSDLYSAQTVRQPSPPVRLSTPDAPTTPSPPDARLARVPVAAAIAIAENRASDVASLIRLLKGELGWIPLKAMRKSREERYQSAAEFADDLRNYLASRPLLAGPMSSGYRLRKFVRRNRGAVAAGSAIGLALLLGAAGTTLGLVRARESLEREHNARKVTEGSLERERTARTLAEQQRDRADTVAKFMRGVFQGVGPQVAAGRDTTLVRQLMDDAATRITSGELKAAPDAELELRLTFSGVYRSLADFDDAAKMLAGAKLLQRPKTSEGSVLLEEGLLLWDKGDPAAAEPILSRVLEITRADTGAETMDLMQALTAEAGVLDALGRYEQSNALYRETLDLAQQLHPGDHADVAGAMSNLARSKQMLNDMPGAVEMLQAAYDMYTRLGTGDSPDFAATTNNLAICLQATGHTSEALTRFDQSLAMRRRIYPPDHPDIAQGLSNLAYVKLQTNKLDEAEAMFVQALQIRRAAFRGDHPSIAKTLINLATTRSALGRPAEAETLYVEAADMLKRLFPEGHPDIAVTLSNLASVQVELKQFDAAESLLVEALGMLDRQQPEGETDTIIILRKLGNVREQLGRPEEAAESFARALVLARAQNPGENMEVVRSLHGLARCRLKAGQVGPAMEAATEAMTMAQKLLPAESAGLTELRKTIEQIEAARGNGAEAVR